MHGHGVRENVLDHRRVVKGRMRTIGHMRRRVLQRIATTRSMRRFLENVFVAVGRAHVLGTSHTGLNATALRKPGGIEIDAAGIRREFSGCEFGRCNHALFGRNGQLQVGLFKHLLKRGKLHVGIDRLVGFRQLRTLPLNAHHIMVRHAVASPIQAESLSDHLVDGNVALGFVHGIDNGVDHVHVGLDTTARKEALFEVRHHRKDQIGITRRRTHEAFVAYDIVEFFPGKNLGIDGRALIKRVG